MNEQETAVTVRSESLSLKQVTDRVNLVHEILNKVMLKGTHYGSVPGCGKKDVLLKPGADLLAMTFRLVPQFKVERTDLENGHREFDVTCSMFNPSGELLGQGVGSASTMEKKYRYRWEGEGESRHKTENEDIADVYNTVLKIAKKRAHIDATLTVTGAADIFTQDLIEDDDEHKPEIKPPQSKSAQQQPAPADGDANLITEKQRNRLFAIAHTSNVSEEDLRKHLKEVYKLDHSKDIRKSWYDSICQWVEAGGQNLSDADENQAPK